MGFRSTITAGGTGNGVTSVNGDPGPAVTLDATDVGAADTATLTAHTGDTANPHAVTKTQVGLGNVDNTADTAKPVSTATSTALGLKADASTVVALTGNQTVAGVKTFSSEPSAPSLKVTGVTGAANQGRFVGVTTVGSPTTGTFAVGDWVVTQAGGLWICVAAGTPGRWYSPTDIRDALTTGEETIDRRTTFAANLAATSGSLRLTHFTARKTETTSNVRVASGGTAAGATPTLCRIGLYTIAANGDGTLVANVASDTALFATANTMYTKAWATPYAKLAGQRYALGVLVVTAAAAPTLAGNSLGAGLSAEAALAPRLSGALAGQTDLPSTFTDASLTATGHFVYAALV